MQTNSFELRPVRSSFLISRLLAPSLVLLVMTCASAAVLAFSAPGYTPVPLLVFATLVVILAIDARVALRKEVYQVSANAITARSGGLWADRQADLDLRNVTHVRQHLPWLRYRFFNVGDVLIQSAGSSQSQVVLRCVNDPDAVYQTIRSRLRENGFSLSANELLYEEQPDRIGVFVEVLGMLAGIGILAVWLGGSILLEMGGGALAAYAWMEENAAMVPAFIVPVTMYGVPILILGGALTLAALHYLDLRRRTYRVFNDVVVYEEGFLSRTNAFIPYENIADADLLKTLVDQILGLSDVKISCQGSSQEVKFRRLRRGDELKQAVGVLVNSANTAKRSRLPTAPGNEGFPVHQPAVSGFTQASVSRSALPPELAWTATLKPVPMRAIATVAWLLPIVPAWLAATVSEWLLASTAVYTVGATSIGLRRGVFRVNEREFSYDKVTGVVVRSGPLDGFFGTASIEIWSIGSNEPLSIAHIKKEHVDLTRLLRNLGIEQTPALSTIPLKFGPSAWLRSSIFGFALLATCIAAMVIAPVAAQEPLLSGFVLPVLAAVCGLYVWRQASVTRTQCSLHASHVELQKGIWWKEHFHVRYDDIKKTSLTRYPGGRAGRLTLFAAGERIIQQNNQNGPPVPYSIVIPFVDDVEGLLQRMDSVIAGMRDPRDPSRSDAAQVLREMQPAIANTVATALFVGLLVLPFAPILIPVAVARARRRRYRFESDRVVRSEGIFYRTESAVLYQRIDSIRQDQGLLGKMFGNGNVTIFTAGSSRPDLILDALPDHAAAYQLLQEKYRNRASAP